MKVPISGISFTVKNILKDLDYSESKRWKAENSMLIRYMENSMLGR